ncbi:MAG: hypothetical protein JXQ96_09065 [Cyclobacteriaceae bacterium]
MKRIAITLALILAVSLTYGQSRKDLKGPRAKNYKVWEHKTEASSINVVTYDVEKLQGPLAKNQKVWENEIITGQIVVSSVKPKLKGPAAKNYKPWKDKSEIDVGEVMLAKD